MKILLVSNGMPLTAFGGVEIYTSDLAQALAAAGHEISVFCRESDFSSADYSVSDRIEGGLRLIRVVNDYKQITSFRETFLDNRIEQIFQAALEQLRPDAVHFQHLIALSARLPAVAAAQRIPFITTLHDFWPLCQRVNLSDWRAALCDGPQQGGDCFVCTRGGPGQAQLSPEQTAWIGMFKRWISPGIRRRIRRVLFPHLEASRQPPALVSSQGIFEERYAVFKRSISLSAHVLTPSAYVRSRYLANGYPAEITVLPLGIDPPDRLELASRSSPQENDPMVIGVIGSVIPIKGIHVLIRAFRAVQHANLRLHIYGRTDVEPGYLERLEELAAQDERIRFKGPFSTDQRSQIYDQIDLVVIPSVVPETFSLVAHEALLHRKPVVASRLGAMDEIIRDQVNGFLYPPAEPDELTRILSSVAVDPRILQSLDLPGPVPIDSLAGHCRSLEALYNRLIDR